MMYVLASIGCVPRGETDATSSDHPRWLTGLGVRLTTNSSIWDMAAEAIVPVFVLRSITHDLYFPVRNA